MGSQEMPNQGNNRGLVLSVDAKPRLKWTRQLHECFTDAVSQLGGADKATPKSLMRNMGVPGLTLYHLKSHLQACSLPNKSNTFRIFLKRKLFEEWTTLVFFRNIGSRRVEIRTQQMMIEKMVKYSVIVLFELKTSLAGLKWSSVADCEAANNKTIENEAAHIDEEKTPAQFDETMLQMQMEVQRKLQEQIEVQRHLQLRIEAQGKYLQSVLRKAQEALASYSSNSLGVEAAKAELSELLSAVETECLSSSLSQGSLIPKRAEHADCSTDSCLTSSIERQEAKVQKQCKLERSSSLDNWSEGSEEINPNSRKTIETRVNDKLSGAKRSCSSVFGEASVKQPAIGMQETNSFGVPRELDLNR